FSHELSPGGPWLPSHQLVPRRPRSGVHTQPPASEGLNRKAKWGEALTAEKMKKCVWVRPELLAQIEFLEWTDADHLRHSKFARLRDDKNPRQVRKEHTRN